MALVWFIDVLVLGIKVLGGRTNVNPVLRFALWLAVLSVLVAAFAVLGVALVLLDRRLHTVS